jgi:hypothetical protein
VPDVQKTGEPDARESEGRSQGLLWWFLMFGFLLIIYPLSVGPVIKLCDKGLLSKKVVMVYGPLDTLMVRSRTLERFFDWYLEDVWKIKG